MHGDKIPERSGAGATGPGKGETEREGVYPPSLRLKEPGNDVKGKEIVSVSH